ncbi:hypothetical protein [Allokutzneria albata]|uniref:hypothetical protein n=1 Tax=Allokutzneria albata TaxID=211114 RepID=UPI00069373B7|nr:hypothetical protein [Allokutzneria albata]
MDDCFPGQRNGLCGAAAPGFMFLHTGQVGFTVELHDSAPPVDEAWEDVVEVPYRPQPETALAPWGAGTAWDLALAETGYRVRYCGMRMDAGQERYLLQFWPVRPAPDQVTRGDFALPPNPATRSKRTGNGRL